ncbi:MAG: bifunctional nuclease family protein [Bacteroidales bacterium]|nr:bifunctional nuclease family protein [Bacteroidales bacterium]
MDEERVKLTMLGISFSPLTSGAYAMILEDEERRYRIQMVIGAMEAQSISTVLEGITSLRPMTHDLFCNFSRAFGVRLIDVYIYKYEDGIFSAEMRFADDKREVTIDARTSDAVSIAVRMGAPIFINRQLLKEVAILRDDLPGPEIERPVDPAYPSAQAEPENMTVQQLQNLLDKYISEENYEEAARISQILKSKK